MNNRSPRPDPFSVSLTRFAALCGVGKSTVTDWCNRGMPGVIRGRARRQSRIDLRQAIPWAITYRDAPAPGSERERLAKEQADKVALENAVTRGELVYADQVGQALAEIMVALVARLEAVPGRHAGDLAPITDRAAMRAKLLQIAREVRTQCADDIRKLADRLGEGKEL